MSLNQLIKKTTLKELDSLPFVNFEPATLKEWATGWQIEYRIFNPDSGLIEKRRIRFEKIRKRIGNDTKARKYARVYCDAITRKLESGWNPYKEGNKIKSFHKLTDALKSYLNEKELDMNNGVFSYDSMRAYMSQARMFIEWLKMTRNEDIYVGYFNLNNAQEYLDYVYIEKKVTPRSWNNYLSFLRCAWNWLIEKNYCTENVFIKIRLKPKTEKERTIIPPEWNCRIMEYFRSNMPEMEIVCGLIYNSFMRPAEISRTQICDIQISQNGIYLPAHKTKNKKSRWCLLPPHIIEMILKIRIDKFPTDYYLFSIGLRPGKAPLNTRKLDKYWHKMREAIDLPPKMQLYSYRDTGITDLKLAGHSNLFISSITGHRNSDEIETYTHEPDRNALQYIMKKSKKL